MIALALWACHPDEPSVRSPPASPEAPVPTGDTAPTTSPPEAPCPSDMVLVEDVCMDRYEAPNQPGALPLVMLTFDEAEAWCGARGRRLCFDDEWVRACAGPDGAAYPYGDVHDPGVCNDDEVWRVYDQGLLSAWPYGLDVEAVDSLDALYALVRDAGAAAAADHVASLYQGEGSGDNAGCGGAYGVFDLVGNVEEWTRRRDGGAPDFHGNLKGRYWAESRTCQSDVTVHGDSFRFYEIGLRCCTEPSR